jgi:2-keto-4-pentenoate hydratase
MTQPTFIDSLASDLFVARTRSQHLDWPPDTPPDLPTAYQASLAVRAARIGEGETPVGYKVGFTNRTIWPRYGVYSPIWGIVWRSTLTRIDAASSQEAVVSLAGLCEPRIEPEIVFGLRESPAAGCDLAGLADAIDWIAHGF